MTGTYEKRASELGRLVDEKQAAYGNSFGKAGEILKILYPNGIKAEQYDDVLTIVRVLDKLFRVATRKDAFGESPWSDVGGYALLAAVKDEDPKPSPKCVNNCLIPACIRIRYTPRYDPAKTYEYDLCDDHLQSWNLYDLKYEIIRHYGSNP